MTKRNRHKPRRAARAPIPFNQIHSACDIQVDAKFRQFVMILANAKGREVVEELWPDVQWENDELFSSVHSPDWSFTHICVTKLPPHLETQIPLAFASPDAIGFAVAMALQRIAEPKRVAHYTGEGDGLTLNFYDGAEACGGRDLALSLFAEYVPSGPVRPDHPESAN